MPIIQVWIPDKMLEMLSKNKALEGKEKISVFLRNMMILGTVKYIDAKRSGEPIEQEIQELIATLVPSDV